MPSRLAWRRWSALAVVCVGALGAVVSEAQTPGQQDSFDLKEPTPGGYFTAPSTAAPSGTPLPVPTVPLSPNTPPSTLQTQPTRPSNLGNLGNLGNRENATKDMSQGRQDTLTGGPPATPPPPNEFQKFVEAATGRVLPMFGSSFFTSAGKSGNAVDNVPVAADYVVGPGDELLIRAWGAIDVDYRATVDRNGQVTLPKVGTFTVAGTKASNLESYLRTQIGRYFTNFNLSVTLGQLRGLSVFVVGPAVRPGVYKLPSQSTLLSAVVAAGGPSNTGSMRHIGLRRDGKVLSELDMYSFLVLGDKSKDLQLANGDVVVFQPTGPQVALTGAVDTPAIFELSQAQEAAQDVLRYAGNLPILANPHSAVLERIDPARPRSARVVETVKLDEAGMRQALRDGDVLTVQPISPAFSNAVTLRGYVAEALRHPYTPGMKVLDLVPDKEALISFDFYRRRNTLVQVVRNDPARVNQGNNNNNNNANTMGNAGGNANLNSAFAPEERTGQERRRSLPTPLLEEVNWDYATIERLNPQDLSPQVIPFNLGRALLQGDASQNLPLQPGDVVTIYSRKDIRGPMARQTRLVSVEGEVMTPGVYQLLPGETLRSLLTRVGGFTPQAYVYGLEFAREETRQRQRENLQSAIARLEALAAVQTAREATRTTDSGTAASPGMTANEAARRTQLARLSKLEPNGRIALELSPDTASVDALPDVPLDNGDRISVPSRPGFVTVAGAVVNNNAYLWKPGRTAGDYVKLAGLEETSDTGNMFILRADGTVSHAADHNGFFNRSIQSQTLYPGDAVVVPNQLDYETWGRALVRNLKDWSQIFYQFGLGAAAIRTLQNN